MSTTDIHASQAKRIGILAAMPQELRDALSKHYPQDQATGYRNGDLRGALWAEAPLGRDAQTQRP